MNSAQSVLLLLIGIFLLAHFFWRRQDQGVGLDEANQTKEIIRKLNNLEYRIDRFQQGEHVRAIPEDAHAGPDTADVLQDELPPATPAGAGVVKTREIALVPSNSNLPALVNPTRWKWEKIREWVAFFIGIGAVSTSSDTAWNVIWGFIKIVIGGAG